MSSIAIITDTDASLSPEHQCSFWRKTLPYLGRHKRQAAFRPH